MRTPISSWSGVWVTTILLAAVSTACSATVSMESANTLVLSASGEQCLAGPGAGEEVCVGPKGTGVSISINGLEIGSTLSLQGQEGDTVDFSVDSVAPSTVDVDGQVVEAAFTVRGTWADGTPISMTVEPAA